MNQNNLKARLAQQIRNQQRALRPAGPYSAAGGAPQGQEQFSDFGASELYCPKCQRSMPVREKQLLLLPGGELYDYVCVQCSSSLGTRKT